MSGNGFPKPCEVLVDGEWLPATLVRWYRWPDGSWRGSVTYRRLMTIDQLGNPFGRSGDDVPFWFNFEQTRRPEELREAPRPNLGLAGESGWFVPVAG